MLGFRVQWMVLDLLDQSEAQGRAHGDTGRAHGDTAFRRGHGDEHTKVPSGWVSGDVQISLGLLNSVESRQIQIAVPMSRHHRNPSCDCWQFPVPPSSEIFQPRQFLAGTPGAEEIKVSCRTMRLTSPQVEQCCSLEDELRCIWRNRKAVQQSFKIIPGQNELQVFASLTRQIRQPLPYGGCDVARRFARHVVASR